MLAGMVIDVMLVKLNDAEESILVYPVITTSVAPYTPFTLLTAPVPLNVIVFNVTPVNAVESNVVTLEGTVNAFKFVAPLNAFARIDVALLGMVYAVVVLPIGYCMSVNVFLSNKTSEVSDE